MARGNLGLVLPACCCVAAVSGPGGGWLGMADDGNNTLASLVVAPPLQLPGTAWPWQQAIRAAAGLPVASLARLARHVLLEPWGHPVTAAQLLLCLKAAERCVARLLAQMQAADGAGAAVQREGDPAAGHGSTSEAVTPVVGLLAQLRGHCEHQPNGDVPAALHRAEEALATARAALQLATELAQRWQQAAAMLGGPGAAAALVQELLFSSVSLLQWGGAGAAAAIAAGADAAGAAPAGRAAVVAAAQLVAALAAMPGTQRQALAAALDCDLRSELSLVLASGVEAALSCRVVSLQQCALDTEAIEACAQAAASLPAVQAGDQPQERSRALVDCAGNLARLVVLLVQHCSKDAIGALDAGVVAVCREALAFSPVAQLDFVAAGDCLLAVREAVNANPGLGLALASGSYLEELVGWAEAVARNLKRGTAEVMLLTLQPARLLVSTVAAAVLGCTRVDRFGLAYQAWFKVLKRFRALPEPKLRGTYTWEQLARREVLPQVLAWASSGAAAEGAPGA